MGLNEKKEKEMVTMATRAASKPMERSLSKETYYIAFAITAGVFLLGLLLGLVIEGKRVDYVQDHYQEQKLALSSSQLQYLFFDRLEEKKNCPAMFTTFYANLEDLEKTRIRLEQYERKATLEKKSFELLEREYLLAEMRYWLLATDIKTICDFDVVTILYFYSNEQECPGCDSQSFVLSYLKDLFGDRLLTFSFNAELTSETMLDILKKAYNVTSYPTLVIDTETINGFNDKDEVLQEICVRLKEKPQECIQEI